MPEAALPWYTVRDNRRQTPCGEINEPYATTFTSAIEMSFKLILRVSVIPDYWCQIRRVEIADAGI